jgi:hypothetical protein
MPIRATRNALSRLFSQRCFWLFTVLLILIGAVSFVPASDRGRLVLNGINIFLLIAAVAAVGRTIRSFIVVTVLAVPAVWFQYLGLRYDRESDLMWSWMFSTALYLVTIGHLVRYVFQPRVMTEDKLFGAAAAYLLIGVLWAYFTRSTNSSIRNPT